VISVGMLRIVYRLLICLCAAGCGDGGGDLADAAPPDAPPLPDAPSPPDAPPPPLRRSYVLDRITLPADGTAGLTLDLDGNGTRENRLGSLLATLRTQSGNDEAIPFLRQVEVDRAVDRGELITLLDLVSPTFREGEVVAATMVGGADPVPVPCSGGDDRECRRHLAGDGRFAIGDGTAPGELAGIVIAGDIEASGNITLRLPFASGAVIDLPLAAARLEVHDVSTGIAGLLGGGIRERDIDGVVVPAIGAGFRASVAAHCGQVPDEPGVDRCGCPGGTGRTLLGLFDIDDDCVLADAEVAESPFVRTLLQPDLDLEAPARQNDALSFVVGIGAVPATWPAAP
jgi:hypothetical protein